MRVFRRDKLDAELGHADLVDLFAHAQALEQLDVARQQRLADVKARMLGLFQQHHVAALLRQQRGHGRAGWAAADDEHVALDGFCCGHRCIHASLFMPV